MKKSSCLKSEIKPLLRHEVSWGDIVIYEFPNILGDHPGRSGKGSALTIDWNHERCSTVAIDFYEYYRQSNPRRSRKELFIPDVLRDTL